MNGFLLKRILWIPAVAAILGTLRPCAAETPHVARLLKHAQGDGRIVQALLIRLPEGEMLESVPVTAARDHLVFLDTSASQIGAHRLHALAVLESMLSALPDTDRVRLFAIDVEAEALMPSFADVSSDVVASAIAELKLRIPLGATNMRAVVETALKSKDVDRACSIIYLGDGMSTAHLLATHEFRALVTELRHQRIPFHSYGVGPDINLQVLGILAHQTGGYVDFDRRIDTSEKSTTSFLRIASERGEQLGKAVQQAVFFPATVEIRSGTNIPLPTLPFRFDRDTIHVVRGDLALNTQIRTTTDHQHEALRWTVSSPIEPSDTAFLVAVADEVEKDDGLSNSLAGLRLLQIYQRNFHDSMNMALQIGDRQLQQGHADQAALIAQRVAEVDASNPRAKALAESAENLRTTQITWRSEPRTGPDPDVSLVRDQEQVVRVMTEKLRSQVSTAIGQSKRGDPESGLAVLKHVDNAVRSASDIAPEDRLQLRKRLESEIGRLRIELEKQTQEGIRTAERLAQLQAQKRLNDQFQLDEERLEGLLDRVRALLLEAKHGRDEAYGEAQNVADIAVNLNPGEGTSTAARFDSESAQQLNRAFRLRARRADQLLETLHQVELSHIPFPDEPPIRYPSADVWKALTERRRKWASVDLKVETPQSQRINGELKTATEVNFTDIPLKDALDYLEELHHIQIWVDMKALSDEGISTDSSLNLTMSGVSLRTVLRLMLEPLLLTYVIEDEFLKITTQTVAADETAIRVYPIADLVVPIQQAGGAGGGLGGGQGGGLGGGGGGLGGGLGGGIGGGLGGGFGGGGGGGLGGGFFSLSPEPIPLKRSTVKGSGPDEVKTPASVSTKRSTQ